MCFLKELFAKSKRFSFDLHKAFPDDCESSVKLLRLLSAANDIVFLQRLYLDYAHQKDDVGKEVKHAEGNFILLLAMGFLREGLSAFKHLYEDPAAKKLFPKLDKEGREALSFLESETYGATSLHEDVLKDIRDDATFHYQYGSYVKALCSIRQHTGHFIIGQTPAATRFLIADDIRSEIVRSSIDFSRPDDNDVRDRTERIFKAMGRLVSFSHWFLIAYLDEHHIEVISDNND